MQLYIDLTVDKIKTGNNELINQPQVVNSEQKKTTTSLLNHTY